MRKQKPAAPVKPKAKASAEDADPARVIRKAATEALRLITVATNNYKVMESICKEIGAVVNPRAVKWLETQLQALDSDKLLEANEIITANKNSDYRLQELANRCPSQVACWPCRLVPHARRACCMQGTVQTWSATRVHWCWKVYSWLQIRRVAPGIAARARPRIFFSTQNSAMVQLGAAIEEARQTIPAILEFAVFRDLGLGQRGGTNFSMLRKCVALSTRTGCIASEFVGLVAGVVWQVARCFRVRPVGDVMACRCREASSSHLVSPAIRKHAHIHTHDSSSARPLTAKRNPQWDSRPASAPPLRRVF